MSPPAQAERLAEPATGIDEEDRQIGAARATRRDGREQPPLLLRLEKADAAGFLALAAELGQAVNVSHAMGLPQKLAQRGHLAIDGRIRIAPFAQRPDQPVEHLVGKGRKLFPGKNFVQFAEKRHDIVFVPSFLPQNVGIAPLQTGEGECAHRPQPRPGALAIAIARLDRQRRGAEAPEAPKAPKAPKAPCRDRRLPMAQAVKRRMVRGLAGPMFRLLVRYGGRRMSSCWARRISCCRGRRMSCYMVGRMVVWRMVVRRSVARALLPGTPPVARPGTPPAARPGTPLVA